MKRCFFIKAILLVLIAQPLFANSIQSDGVCGISAGGFFTEAPAANLCAGGTESPVGDRSSLPWATNGPFGGDVRALAIDPVNPSTIYAGTSGSGVYKSIDGGASWRQLNFGQSNIDVLSLVIDPGNSATIFAVTVNGLYKSVNSGSNWSISNEGMTYPSPSTIVIDPVTPATIYAASSFGVHKSTNNGTSWNRIYTDLTVGFRTFAIDPGNTATIYGGTGTNGVYKSTDNGISWSPVNTGLTNLRITALVLDKSSPVIIYAGTNGDGVFKSTDGGSSWKGIGNGLYNGFVNALAVDATVPDTIIAGTSGGVYRSMDGGNNWAMINTGMLNSFVFALAIDPGSSATVYAGTWGGGVFKSNDHGDNWSASSHGLTSIDIKALAVDPTDPATIYAGNWGATYKSTDGGRNWNQINKGMTFTRVNVLVIDPVNHATIYAGYDGEGVFKSTNGGESWSHIGLYYSQVSALAIDPSMPTTMYAGTYLGGIYKSTDGGTSWTQINSGLTNTYVLALVLNPHTPDIIYVGTKDGGVFKSINGGNSWSQINSGLTKTYISALAIDPRNPANVYVGANNGGLSMSTNGGASWSQVSSVPTYTNVYGLVIDSSMEGSIYAGTYEGIYKNTNSGGNWIKIGLADEKVSALALGNGIPATLYAGTMKGVFSSTQATQSAHAGSGYWHWTCNGSNTGENASCSASIPTYTVSATVTGGNATINCTSPVEHGANSFCTIDASPGFQTATFFDNGAELYGPSISLLYIVDSVSEIHTISASFKDSQPPLVTNLTLPGTSNSLTVSGISITSDDNVAVAGYLLSESARKPAVDDVGWSNSTPVSFTFASVGNKSLNAFAKDAAGNVSVPTSANVTIELPVNGACGSANGTMVTTPHTTSLCSAGQASPVRGDPLTWSCISQNGGTAAACSANIQTYTVDFQSSGNGSLSGITTQTVKYGAPFTRVFAVPAADYHFANWTGVAGIELSSSNPITIFYVTTDTTITANFAHDPVNGACGSSDGKVQSTAPTANLCTIGTASAISGSGPWNWLCSGQYGGSNASCSANKAKPGDADADGSVSIAEVQAAINMFLGVQTVDETVDTDANNSVSIAEVQKAINAFLGLDSATAPKSAAKLVQLSTNSELEAKLKSELVKRYDHQNDVYLYGWRNFLGGPVMMDGTRDLATTAAMTTSGAEKSTTPAYSETNVQEKGVDEGDYVKTDGNYLYLARGSRFIIIKTQPPEEAIIISDIDLKEEIGEIYLNGNQVTLVTAPIYYYYGRPAVSGLVMPGHPVTRLYLYDIANRTAPVLKSSFDFPGTIQGSRRIGDLFYLVTNYGIDLPNPVTPWNYLANGVYDEKTFGAASQAAREENLSRIARLTLPEMLPSYSRTAYSAGVAGTPVIAPVVNGSDVYAPITGNGADLSLVIAINTAGETPTVASSGVLSSWCRLYMSADSLYLASANDWLWIEPQQDTGKQPLNPEPQTSLHKFSITAGSSKPLYRGSGVVNGWLNDRFSMGEFNGYLRIGTTRGGWWGEGISNRLAVLTENNGELIETGSVGNIAPGERIYSMRLDRNRGYMVTFRQTDPLYTFDLTDPFKPRIAGEIKVDGFATYIHPMGENNSRLLTIGRSADNTGRVTGNKLQLFDVANLDTPLIVASQELGQGWSNALYDPHAFLYYEPLSLLAIPYFSYGQTTDSFWNYSSGLSLFTVTNTGITPKGTVAAKSIASGYYSYNDTVDRSVVIGTDIYAIAHRSVTIADTGTLAVKKSVDLPEGYGYYPLAVAVDDAIKPLSGQN